MQARESYSSDCHLPYFHCCRAALRSTMILWTCPFLLHLSEQGKGSRHPGSHLSARVSTSLTQKSQNGNFPTWRFHCEVFNHRFFFFFFSRICVKSKVVSDPWDGQCPVMSELPCPRGSGGGDSQVSWPCSPEVSVGVSDIQLEHHGAWARAKAFQRFKGTR